MWAKRGARKAILMAILFCGWAKGEQAWAEMREFATDRPDKTESPYTVDAGHFQIETDLVTFTSDKATSEGVETKVRSMALMTSNIKVGLTRSSDLQLVLTPYQSEKIHVSGSNAKSSASFGDTMIRYKYNLMGNDDGDIAIGVMPFLKFPTHSGSSGNREIEGGLILPVALSLPHDWSLGMMAQINRNQSQTGTDFYTDFISSVTASHRIFGALAGYLEFYSESSAEADTTWIATVDLGLTYGLSSNTQVDLGCNFGVTEAADDLNPFVGFSARY